MVEVDIPHVFMSVEELAKRWQCGISVIEILIETGQIYCCIRPVALEIAFERNWPPEQRPNIPLPKHHHLDQKEIYRLFRHSTIPQTINSHKKKTQKSSVFRRILSCVMHAAKPQKPATFIPNCMQMYVFQTTVSC